MLLHVAGNHTGPNTRGTDDVLRGGLSRCRPLRPAATGSPSAPGLAAAASPAALAGPAETRPRGEEEGGRRGRAPAEGGGRGRRLALPPAPPYPGAGLAPPPAAPGTLRPGDGFRPAHQGPDRRRKRGRRAGPGRGSAVAVVRAAGSGPGPMASSSSIDIEDATQHLRDILKLDRPGGEGPGPRGRGRPPPAGLAGVGPSPRAGGRAALAGAGAGAAGPSSAGVPGLRRPSGGPVSLRGAGGIALRRLRPAQGERASRSPLPLSPRSPGSGGEACSSRVRRRASDLAWALSLTGEDSGGWAERERFRPKARCCCGSLGSWCLRGIAAENWTALTSSTQVSFLY